LTYSLLDVSSQAKLDALSNHYKLKYRDIMEFNLQIYINSS